MQEDFRLASLCMRTPILTRARLSAQHVVRQLQMQRAADCGQMKLKPAEFVHELLTGACWRQAEQADLDLQSPETGKFRHL